MESFLLKIGTFYLAFLVLFSSVSFTVYRHFCQGEVTRVSLMESTKPCCLKEKPKTVAEEIQGEGCCKEVSEYKKNASFKQGYRNILSILVKIGFEKSCTPIFLLPKKTVSKKLILFANFSPTLFIFNRNILYATLLI